MIATACERRLKNFDFDEGQNLPGGRQAAGDVDRSEPVADPPEVTSARRFDIRRRLVIRIMPLIDEGLGGRAIRLAPSVEPANKFRAGLSKALTRSLAKLIAEGPEFLPRANPLEEVRTTHRQTKLDEAIYERDDQIRSLSLSRGLDDRRVRVAQHGGAEFRAPIVG